MTLNLSRVLFFLFLLSGFCSLLYQVVWVRLAFASFGIVSPVLSVVLSVFMLGLSLGSWVGGRLIEQMARKTKTSAILFYAMAETAIGVGAFVVPKFFALGEKILLPAGNSDSLPYLVLSAALIAASIFPWCFFMGTTFPFMMRFINEVDPSSTKSFSFLYLANVIGALLGTVVTATLLVEFLGFRHTLWVAGFANFFIAASSAVLGSLFNNPSVNQQPVHEPVGKPPSKENSSHVRAVLFTTGFTSLGMEVVWTRNFTPILGTQVYAFAFLLATYLFATWTGSSLYRRHVTQQRIGSTATLIVWLSVFAFFPIVINDPRINLSQVLTSLGGGALFFPLLFCIYSIFPFCLVLGYLTPKLIDECTHGSPHHAGSAYALNILGCILGPLFASYVLLPSVGAKSSMVILAVPFLCFYFVYSRSVGTKLRWVTGLISSLFFISALFVNVSYEDPKGKVESYVVRRDHTATVISYGKGWGKRLLVNGVGITQITPVTKIMAHLPLAFCKAKPQSALVICFGMGTTYRSALSWDIQTTAVELVPSVVKSFGFYFDDAEALLMHPKGRVVIDDGRRFLRRTNDRFDFIILDPPPPAGAAGSSLLYSENFYDLAKEHLNPGGILQQWFAKGEQETLNAVARSLSNSFTYVRVYGSVEGWGYHFLASLRTIETPTVEEMMRRLPAKAQQDLLEWSANKNLREEIHQILSKEVPLARLLNQDPNVRITDDQPFNEYFLVRRIRSGHFSEKEEEYINFDLLGM